MAGGGWGLMLVPLLANPKFAFSVDFWRIFLLSDIFVTVSRQDIYWRELLSSRHLSEGATPVKTFNGGSYSRQDIYRRKMLSLRHFQWEMLSLRHLSDGDALVKTFSGGSCSR